MRFLFYTHSLISDWNNGNAHFLRGVMRELQKRGHVCCALEPADSWSRLNLVREQGEGAIAKFQSQFPMLRAEVFGAAFDHERALDGADVVVVHEWTDPALIARIGRARRNGGRFKLLFHDTHHRAVTRKCEIASLPLADYDAVLAFGEAIRERYADAGWAGQVFTWHEAADVELFKPQNSVTRDADLVWIGNWGDEERSRELHEYLIEPARALGLRGDVFGVRYPGGAIDAIKAAGLSYRGWIANADAAARYGRYRVTLHVPRRPYVEALPGIPTIRVFEALASGIPLICAPWEDCESLFRPGTDFLMARSGDEMKRLLFDVLWEPRLAMDLARSGLETIHAQHTCAHRAIELENILARLRSASSKQTEAAQ
ncbi:MAG: glycosyltransferase [Beijerinckiaceae bacterium]